MRISFYNNEKKIFEMENVSQKYKWQSILKKQKQIEKAETTEKKNRKTFKKQNFSAKSRRGGSFGQKIILHIYLERTLNSDSNCLLFILAREV